MLTDQNMKEKYQMIKEMEKEFIIGQMGIVMKVVTYIYIYITEKTSHGKVRQ